MAPKEKRWIVVGSLALAGFILAVSPDSAQAQYGTYYGYGYGYGFGAPVVVAPPQVVMFPPPVVVMRGPAIYAPPVSCHRPAFGGFVGYHRSYGYSHRQYIQHGRPHRGRSMSFGFSYSH